jgi:hypothetical protein
MAPRARTESVLFFMTKTFQTKSARGMLKCSGRGEPAGASARYSRVGVLVAVCVIMLVVMMGEL